MRNQRFFLLYENPGLCHLKIQARQLRLARQQSVLFAIWVVKLHPEPPHPMPFAGDKFVTMVQAPTLLQGKFERLNRPTPMQPVRQEVDDLGLLAANTEP